MGLQDSFGLELSTESVACSEAVAAYYEAVLVDTDLRIEDHCEACCSVHAPDQELIGFTSGASRFELLLIE